MIVAFLSACSSGDKSGLAKTVFQRVANKPTPAPSSSGGVTRAALEKADLAAIRASVSNTRVTSVNVAVSVSNGNVTYVGKDNRSILLRGGLIRATHGYGYDLAPMALDREDPIANLKRLDQWPQSIQRQYSLAGIGPARTPYLVHCTYQNLGGVNIEILEHRYALTKVVEHCQGDDISFTNTYWVNPDTGFIWMSDQWSGPRQGMIRLEVLEPLD